MSMHETKKQPVTWVTIVVAAMLAFFSAYVVAGFGLVPSAIFGLVVWAAAVAVRSKSSVEK